MTLYSSFLAMAPFILLAVTKGAFGPWGVEEGDEWRYSFLWDLGMVLSVIAGAVVSVLILGDVIAASATTRWFVIFAACLSLLLLAIHMTWEVATAYRAHRHDDSA
jgi:hypothetical protein